MFKKLETVIIMDIYDAKGQKIGQKAEYIYKHLLKVQDIIIGLILALLIGSQIWN